MFWKNNSKKKENISITKVMIKHQEESSLYACIFIDGNVCCKTIIQSK